MIVYASRTLSKAETNYSTTKKECLAVVWAITKFRLYMHGSLFRVVTDHYSLCSLTNLKNPSGRLSRRSLRLQEFDMTVLYKSGRKHSDADCLTRAPIESALSCAQNDYYDVFIGALYDEDIANLQRNDPDLCPLMDHL